MRSTQLSFGCLDANNAISTLVFQSAFSFFRWKVSSSANACSFHLLFFCRNLQTRKRIMECCSEICWHKSLWVQMRLTAFWFDWPVFHSICAYKDRIHKQKGGTEKNLITDAAEAQLMPLAKIASEKEQQSHTIYEMCIQSHDAVVIYEWERWLPCLCNALKKERKTTSLLPKQLYPVQFCCHTLGKK